MPANQINSWGQIYVSISQLSGWMLTIYDRGKEELVIPDTRSFGAVFFLGKAFYTLNIFQQNDPVDTFAAHIWPQYNLVGDHQGVSKCC